MANSGAKELITFYDHPKIKQALMKAAAHHPTGNMSALLRFLAREELKRQGLMDDRGRLVERKQRVQQPRPTNEDPTTEVIDPILTDADKEL